MIGEKPLPKKIPTANAFCQMNGMVCINIPGFELETCYELEMCLKYPFFMLSSIFY
jgi:hypothetical protein